MHIVYLLSTGNFSPNQDLRLYIHVSANRTTGSLISWDKLTTAVRRTRRRCSVVQCCYRSRSSRSGHYAARPHCPRHTAAQRSDQSYCCGLSGYRHRRRYSSGPVSEDKELALLALISRHSNHESSSCTAMMAAIFLYCKL